MLSSNSTFFNLWAAFLENQYNSQSKHLYFEQGFKVISRLGAGSFGEVNIKLSTFDKDLMIKMKNVKYACSE